MWQEPDSGNPRIMAPGFRSPGKHDTRSDRSSSFVASATGGSGVIKLGPAPPAIVSRLAKWGDGGHSAADIVGRHEPIVPDRLGRIAAWAEDEPRLILRIVVISIAAHSCGGCCSRAA
jgi:hypothetical protein